MLGFRYLSYLLAGVSFPEPDESSQHPSTHFICDPLSDIPSISGSPKQTLAF